MNRGPNQYRKPTGRVHAAGDDCTVCGHRGTVLWITHARTLAWRCAWCRAGRVLQPTGQDSMETGQ